ncbi:MAG: CotH kinase family protein [Flavobacteriales bacterium]
MKLHSALFITICLLFNVGFGQLDHWETVVNDNSTWSYKVPSSTTSALWISPAFDASSWSQGPGGFGFGDNDDNTTIPTNSASVYTRIEFNIANINQLVGLVLNFDYDDGYVAYLNGVEVSRNGLSGGGQPSFNQLANISHEAKLYQNQYPDQLFFTQNQLSSVLVNGTNVLCVEVHNQTISSNDFTCRNFLSIGVNNATNTYGPPPSWFVPPVILTSSNLPIVVLDTYNVDIPDEPKIDGTMGIIFNGDNQINHISDPYNEFYGQIAIEKRGSSSNSFPMKSYGLETRGPDSVNYNVSLFDWPSDNDWILYAPYTDKAMLRNILTYKLGREMGHYAPRTKLCEVVLNGSYIGVYVLMERIKVNPGRVNVDPLNYSDTLNNQLTGGYILKVDKTTAGGVIAWTSPYTAQAPSSGPIYYQMHDPDISDLHPTQLSYIHSYVDNWETVLKSNQFADPQTGFRAYSDENSFIDYLLINEIAKNVDGYRISTFLHKKRFSEGGKLVMGPLWDYNLGWGNANYCQGGQTSGWEINFNSVCAGNGANMNPFWFNRMLEDTVFANNVNCRWTDLRTSILSDSSLIHYIDSMALLLTEPAARNYNRWPILGVYVWPNNYVGNTFQEEIIYMKNWILARTAWMDANMFGTCHSLGFTVPSETAVRVFPNPTNELLYLEGLKLDDQVELLNSIGQTVLTMNIDASEIHAIETTTFTSGVYFLRLNNSNSSPVKIIIQH